MKTVSLDEARNLTYDMENSLIQHIMETTAPAPVKKPVIDPNKWMKRDDWEKLVPYTKSFEPDANGTGRSYGEVVREVGFLEIVLGKKKRVKKNKKPVQAKS